MQRQEPLLLVALDHFNDDRKKLLKITNGNVSWGLMVSMYHRSIDKDVPAAKAAAARNSSCSAAKCSMALEKMSAWGDMSLQCEE